MVFAVFNRSSQGCGVGRVAVLYMVLQFLKCFLKQVMFMQFLLFPPLSLITLESPDRSWLDLGETEVDKCSVPTSVVNNQVAEREDGEGGDTELRGYRGQHVLSFSAPIAYLEAFPHSARAAVFRQHSGCASVRRDARQSAVRPQLRAVPPGSGLVRRGGTKTLCLYFPPFHFGIA